MECLAVGHFSPAITTVKASLSKNNNNNNSPRIPSRNRTPGMRRINGGPSPAKPKQQPSILEVERAIGAGIFRDQDDPRLVPSSLLSLLNCTHAHRSCTYTCLNSTVQIVGHTFSGS